MKEEFTINLLAIALVIVLLVILFPLELLSYHRRYKQLSKKYNQLKEEHNIIKYHHHNVQRAEPIDFLIITTLREEYNAVLSKFSNIREIDNSQSEVKILTTKNFTYHVVIVCLSSLKEKMGPVIAAIKTTAWLNDKQPKNVLLVGIAGGVKGKSDLGDILIPEKIVDASVGKVIEGEKITDYEMYEPDDELFEKTVLTNWSDFLKEKRPKNGTSSIIRGLVISSGEVIADLKKVNSYQKTWRKMSGFEMEGAAVAVAIKHVERQTGFLMIRAISDFGDENKEDDKKWRAYAFDVAASYTRAFIESSPVQPLN
ncbi:phosphorylase family protein [Beggiatoa sp. PS]|nr:phosphorylase family protein [Beggiatoa sp. PS]